MSKLKVRGIVIEAKNKGENDKWLTILCKDIGKISVKARGCRKANSKLFACAKLFSYCDFVIDDHLQFYFLVSGDIIKHFFLSCDDIKTLTLANYFLEMTNKMLKHGQEDNEYMYMLLMALQAMDKQLNDIRTIGYIFELKSLVTIGYMPYMDGCINCSSEDTGYFHPEGTLCEKCAVEESVRISEDTYLAIIQIINAPLNEVFKLKFANKICLNLSECTRLMMRYYTDLNFQSYNFINYMQWY